MKDQMTGCASRESHWQRRMLEFYSQFIQEGDLCFDIGANVGRFTRGFLKLGARVICIEPQEDCLRQLHKLFGNNRSVIIVGKAVGEYEGYGELMISEEHTISTMSDKWTKEGRFSKEHRWTKTQKVSVSTLEALIQLYGLPKFVKIDVEGFEQSVIRGLTKPISFISFEFTREFFDDAKKCMSHLLSIGHVKFNCSLYESVKFLFPEWVTPEELYKKVDSSEDKLLWGDIFAKFNVLTKRGSSI
jgi:FkbM family methyltransferase